MEIYQKLDKAKKEGGLAGLVNHIYDHGTENEKNQVDFWFDKLDRIHVEEMMVFLNN
jgi:hypothetical protein